MKVGDKVKCIKDDPRDGYYGIAERLRCHIGDELVIDKIVVESWGTFLYNKAGQNLNINRAELI